ncbi:MAG: thiamine pyrophosphate-binding protein [Candidatus Daviesbacteria bacterium]|nr:thiamine pyrophosphate-binding protein [Candidatus Daviesbacteria bacterium]
MALGETLNRARERLITPTDVQLVQRFLDSGIKNVVTVPCSITQTIDPIWSAKASAGEMNYWKMVNEHSLVGVTSGVYFGTGELALAHMQNSGIGNALDGFVSYAGVYKIPTLTIVTWRGNDAKDDSEPHQEIGRRTNRLTRDVVDRKSIFGERNGRGILRQVDEAVLRAREGNPCILRLSPDAFKKTYPMTLPEIVETDFLHIDHRIEELSAGKGDTMDSVFKRERISRAEAVQGITKDEERAVILSNGFTAREAQEKADRLGNFYNAGYMGGGLAIGWGMAKSNPDIKVVVVDGDQNAEMGKMTEILANDYPGNLEWYILDNGFGTSVGVSESVPLPWWYYDLAHVIRTVPDKPGEFKSPRVGGRGSYFDLQEAQEMADRIGPLPVHANRFRHWVEMKSQENHQQKRWNEFLERVSR